MNNENKFIITIIFYCLIFALLGFGLGRNIGYEECLNNVVCINA